jgi:curved DNA-binding protein CbpA
MDNRRNYYRILHVQPDAPVEIIRSSYRTLMQRLRQHPDLGGDHWNAALINEAYRTLTNPASRERYDRDRALFSRAGTRPADVVVPQPPAAAPGDAMEFCGFCLAPHGHGRVEDPDEVCTRCASPLYRAERVEHTVAGKRAVERISRDLALSFFVTWPQARGFPGRTRDVSPNGMRFVTEHAVSEGQRLKITSKVFDSIGWVTHRHAAEAGQGGSWVVGVAFETLKFRRSRGAFVSTKA